MSKHKKQQWTHRCLHWAKIYGNRQKQVLESAVKKANEIMLMRTHRLQKASLHWHLYYLMFFIIIRPWNKLWSTSQYINIDYLWASTIGNRIPHTQADHRENVYTIINIAQATWRIPKIKEWKNMSTAYLPYTHMHLQAAS